MNGAGPGARRLWPMKARRARVIRSRLTLSPDVRAQTALVIEPESRVAEVGRPRDPFA